MLADRLLGKLNFHIEQDTVRLMMMMMMMMMTADVRTTCCL